MIEVLINNEQLEYLPPSTHGGIIALSKVPNIVTVQETNVVGSYSSLALTIKDIKNVDKDLDYYIKINGVTITSALENPNANLFLISDDDKVVANSIAKALRNSNLVNYEIFVETAGVVTVMIRAKEIGSEYNISEIDNLNLESIGSLGKSTDSLIGYKVCIDIFQGITYITTLEKTYYKNKVDFNISQVLDTIALYDYTQEVTLKVYAYNKTELKELADPILILTSKGYLVNQGFKYLTIPTKLITFALNITRGISRSKYVNRTLLYTYKPEITFSLFRYLNNPPEVNLKVKYLNLDESIISEVPITLNLTTVLANHTIALEEGAFSRAYYIVLEIPTFGNICYEVIKPINATTKCLRIYYHNSYGGTSFFDFTGLITENHKTQSNTYTKNIFDFYRDKALEQTKVYNKDNSITVTLKSHLMDINGTYQFNDLLASYDAWTTINYQDYKIIITDYKLDEIETGVYEASITYTYSLL